MKKSINLKAILLLSALALVANIASTSVASADMGDQRDRGSDQRDRGDRGDQRGDRGDQRGDRGDQRGDRGGRR